MTQNQSALLALLEQVCSAEEGMRMRQILGAGLQMLIDAEAAEHIGAGRHERSASRTTQRNGTRDRLVATTAGDVTVAIPKTRTGSFFPVAAGTAAAGGSGSARGGVRGLCARGVDP